MTTNPNAVVSGGATLAVAPLVIWVASLFHLTLSAYAGTVIGGALSTVALWVGRDGIRGLAARLWRGQPPQA